MDFTQAIRNLEETITAAPFTAQATYFEAARDNVDRETAYPYPQPTNLELWLGKEPQ